MSSKQRHAAAPLEPKAARATQARNVGQADSANDGYATKRRPAATAEAIEREVRIAYEARQRPPAPTSEPDGDSTAAWDWLRNEAVAMHEITSRLVPAGWTWAIQMEFLPLGVRLVLNGPTRGRKR